MASPQNAPDSGAKSGGGQPHRLKQPPKDPKSPLQLTVKTDKAAYGSGDTVKITLVLKNSAPHPVPLTFASGQKYEVVIKRKSGAKSVLVWTWSFGKMFTQAFNFATVEPGKSLTFTTMYGEPEMAKPRALEPGEYTVTGTITTSDKTARPEATAHFKVK